MSLTNRRLKYFRKDEKNATKEYKEAARMTDNKVVRKMFLDMSKDEAKHAENIKRMLALKRKDKL